MEDDARRRILARRAYFVAAALAGLGACRNATEHEPVRVASARPTEDAGSDAARDEPDAAVDAAAAVVVDGDGDGIPDDLDACPGARGAANPDPKKHGCPCLSIATCLSIRILPQVHFTASAAALPPEALRVLDEVAEILKTRPELDVEITGHCDASEPFAVSERRANVVRDYLVKKGGIDPARLHAVGRGAALPIDRNDTSQGRAHNRRVDFVVVPRP